MITRQQIEQYTDLKREIIMLSDQIYDAENGGEFVVDMVHGSAKEAPYATHKIIINGYASRTVPRLKQRKAMLEKQCAAVECFVEGIKDSMMRQILTRRYIEGRKLTETAKLVGYSVGHTKKIIHAFFEKMIPNDPK